MGAASNRALEIDVGVGRLYGQVTIQSDIAVERDGARRRAGQIAVKCDAAATCCEGLWASNGERGHSQRSARVHGQAAGCCVDGVETCVGASHRGQAHGVRADRDRSQGHVVRVGVGKGAPSGKCHRQVTHVVGGVVQRGRSASTLQRHGGCSNGGRSILGDSTTGRSRETIGHSDVLQFDAVDIGHRGRSSRHNSQLVQVTLGVCIQHDSVGAGGQRGQPRDGPLRVVGDVVVFHQRHVACREREVAKLVASLRQFDVAVSQGHIARVDRRERDRGGHRTIHQIPS